MYAVISAELQAPRLISSLQRTRGLYLRLDRYTYTASRPAVPAAAGFRSIVNFDATVGAGAAVVPVRMQVLEVGADVWGKCGAQLGM